jgi:hypothetical protein
MSICKSILFGTEGNYNICGFPVQFTHESRSEPHKELPKGNSITQLVKACFHTIFLFRAHNLVHELGHSIATKFFVPEYTPKIFIHPSGGATTVPDDFDNLSTWKKVVILTAGTVANIAFSILQLAIVIGCIALSIYIPWGASVFFLLGNYFAICTELEYSCESALMQDDGDFGLIRKIGIKPLAIAGAVVLGQSAVGLFASFHLFGKLI